MARVAGIRTQLENREFDSAAIGEIIGNGDLIEVTSRMEVRLDIDTLRSVLEACGCTGGKKYLKLCGDIGQEMTSLSLEEKLSRINVETETYAIADNGDGTLSVRMLYTNGDKFECVCAASLGKGAKVSDLALIEDMRIMPLSYCLCCAGANRIHTELKFSTAIKVREVVS